MTITAKYAGKCNRCGGQTEVGDMIDWQKGKGASHVNCPKAKSNDDDCYRCSKGWSCTKHTGAAVTRKATSQPAASYRPVYGVEYCGYPCPVTGRKCTASDPCHDCI